jgi:endonuclease/exonuclease/phosphatase family metal-dependent hydrolase
MGQTVPTDRGSGSPPSPLLRGNGLIHILSGVAFLAGCVGALGLAVLYRWPHVSVPVYYFTVRPAFVWFCALTPLLGLGAFGVRFRWLALGGLLWVLCLCATEEVLQVVRPFQQRSADRFSTDRMAFLSFLEAAGVPGGRVLMPLRLVTWNMHGGADGAEAAVGQLAAMDPDIAIIQEFGHAHGRPVLRAISEAEAFKGYAVEGDKLALLSRFPIERLRIEGFPESVGSVWRVHVASELSVLTVNCHLSPLAIKSQILRGWSWSGLDEAIREKQSELRVLRTVLDRYARTETLILGGDFNLPPCYADLRKTVRGLKDCFADAGYGWGKTGPPRLPALRVDQIYVPEEAYVYRCAAVRTRFSDHFPVMAEVAVPLSRNRDGNPTVSGPGQE